MQKYVDKYTSVKRTQGGRATFLAGSAPIAEHWGDHCCSSPDSVCNTEFTWGDRTQLFDQMWAMSGQLCKTTLPLQFQDEACTATRCHFVLLSSECAVLCVYTVHVYVCFCACALWMWIALLELITVQNAPISSHQFTTVTPVPSSQSTISLFVFCVCLFHHCLPSGAFVSQLVQWHRFSAEFTFHQFPRRARGRTSLPPMINKPMILLLYSGWTIYPAPVW